MADTKEQVFTFNQKCEELKKCKFIMATTKIKDLLKCIVNCGELYRLFEAVTKDFDYPAFKAKCLVTVEDGIYQRSFVVLPQTVGQRLAFIFCILVEFDRDTLNFNDFLRKFFPEDGSYYASYRSFCALVIQGLQDAVMQVFREQLESVGPLQSVAPNSYRAELKSVLNLALTEEISFLSESALSDEEKENGAELLRALAVAIGKGDVEYIGALVSGYNYFVLTNKCVSEGVAELMETIGAYVREL